MKEVQDELSLVKDQAFAIIQLKPGSEIKLLRILIENGYTNVSFTNFKGESMEMERAKVIMDDDDDIEQQKPLSRADDDDDSTKFIDANQQERAEVTAPSPQSTTADEDDEEIEIEVDDKEEIVLEDRSNPKVEDVRSVEYTSNNNDVSGKTTPPYPNPNQSSLTLPTVLWPNPGNFSFINPFFPGQFLPTTNLSSSNDLLSINNATRYGIPTTMTTTFPHYPNRIDPSSSLLVTTSAGSLTANNDHHHHQPHQSHQTHSQVLADTPPLTPRGSSNESSCLITGSKLRQRGRQLRQNERDSTAYASCRLCRNRILANRLSNLHNHVRRHSVMKQFHCCYCSYSHTEVAKVRLHMLHNHRDDNSQPLDKRNEDMEAAWALLMKECFPGYA